MKKNIFVIAVAAFALCMAACQKDEPIVINPDSNGNNTPVNSNAKVKSTSDLHNTDWTLTMTSTEFINNLMGTDFPCTDSTAEETYVFGLNFDGTHAHFTFPENVGVYGGAEGIMEQISSISYNYSYDGASHAGYLVVDAEDVDGNDTTAQLVFTYDDDTDVITFELPMAFADNGPEFTLTLNFARNE